MKRFFAAVVCMVSFMVCANAASLRDAVCVVRATPSEKTTAFLTTYRDSLKKQGYGSYAEGIDAYLKGGFGSGFIYEASNGKKYIITNRHVVEASDSVTVEFEKEDGTFDTIKDLKVIAVDDDLDIAVIDFNSTKKSPIPVKATNVDDGEDVWTAGFPGLGGNPAWQFGKGTVTNAIARIDELVPSEVSTLIQHSAQVDSGNSGGPLLVKDAKSAYGYTVVGINTWKAVNRESTNFAIPMKTIKTFIDNAVANKNTNATIDGRLAKFKAAIDKDEQTFGGMATYISSDMITSLTSDTFIKVINTLSRENQNFVIEDFVMDPIEGIRNALSAYIYNSFRKKKVLLPYTSGEAVADGDTYTVTFTVEEKTQIETKWISEQGIWKLADFNGLISSDGGNIKSSGISFYNPYGLGFFGSYTVYPKRLDAEFSVGLDFVLSDMLSYVFKFSKDSYGYQSYKNIGLDVMFNVPVNFGKVILVPSAFAGYGLFIPEGSGFEGFSFGFDYGAEVDVVYDTGSFGPYAGVKFTGKAFKEDPFEAEWTGKESFDVVVGVKVFRDSNLKLW